MHMQKMAITSIMLYECHQHIYKILLWDRRRATVNNFSSVKNKPNSCCANLSSCSCKFSRWLIVKKWIIKVHWIHSTDDIDKFTIFWCEMNILRILSAVDFWLSYSKNTGEIFLDHICTCIITEIHSLTMQTTRTFAGWKYADSHAAVVGDC